EFNPREEMLLDAAAADRFADRIGDNARDIFHQVDPEVHLEPGEALLLALLQPLAVNDQIVRLRGIGVAADLVAKLTAERLGNRHAIRFARQVPQRHLNRTDAAGLPAVAAELFDLTENFIDVAGILAQDAALEEQRIGFAGAVAHLAQAVDTLVGVDT